MNLESKALIAARKIALQASRIPCEQMRSAEQISDDLKFCWNASVAAGDAMFPCSINAKIGYRDFYGDDTLRDVRIQSFFRFNSVTYIKGYCFLRNSLRTFQTARATSMITEGQNVSDLTIAKRLFSVDFDIPDYPEKLFSTDFFVHPRAWGDYRRPMAILMRKIDEQRLDVDQRFKILFHFASESLRSGAWRDWYSDQTAASLCLPAMRLSTRKLSWQRELEELKGGRFSRKALRNTIESF